MLLHIAEDVPIEPTEAPTELFRSSRNFQVWEYHCSHMMLVIRSPQGPKNGDDNIDLLFIGAQYVEIPAYMRGGLAICEPTDEDRRIAGERTGRPLKSLGCFVLLTNGKRFRIVAGQLQISVKKGHYSTPAIPWLRNPSETPLASAPEMAPSNEPGL